MHGESYGVARSAQHHQHRPGGVRRRPGVGPGTAGFSGGIASRATTARVGRRAPCSRGMCSSRWRRSPLFCSYSRRECSSRSGAAGSGSRGPAHDRSDPARRRALGKSLRLHLVMTVFALVATPALLAVMGRALAFDAPFDFVRVAWLVARVVILPVCLGIIIRTYWPAFAALREAALARAVVRIHHRIRRRVVLGIGLVVANESPDHTRRWHWRSLRAGNRACTRPAGSRRATDDRDDQRRPPPWRCRADRDRPLPRRQCSGSSGSLSHCVHARSAAYVRWTSAALTHHRPTKPPARQRPGPFAGTHLQPHGVK